jgi:hypothetical protein
MAKAPKETHHYYLREQFVPAISFSFSVKRDYAPATHYYYYYLFLFTVRVLCSGAVCASASGIGQLRHQEKPSIYVSPVSLTFL